VRVLGIDPGFASVGYAVVVLTPTKELVAEVGLLRTEPSAKKRKVLVADDNFRRSQEIARDLRHLVRDHQIQLICAESMSFPRNASSAAKVALCWGVLASLSHQLGLALLQASPQEVKKRVCGKRDASKEEVQEALTLRFPDLPEKLGSVPASLREHPYDALASVLPCLDSETVKLARQMCA